MKKLMKRYFQVFDSLGGTLLILLFTTMMGMIVYLIGLKLWLEVFISCILAAMLISAIRGLMKKKNK